MMVSEMQCRWCERPASIDHAQRVHPAEFIEIATRPPDLEAGVMKLNDSITTEDEPIVRVFRNYGGKYEIDRIAVVDIDHDSDSFPTFTEAVCEGLIESGEYDDSDGTEMICVYTTDRPDAVRRQLEEWRKP